MPDALELLVKIQTQGKQALDELARLVTKTGKDAADAAKTEGDARKSLTEAIQTQAGAARKATEENNKHTESLTGSIVKAQLLADAIFRVAGAVKDYVVGAAQYAARTEQVEAVMDNLARVNGMNVNSVRMLADGIRDLGISTQDSRAVINTMIGSQIDLSKALDLVRLAQNAAKIAGLNSTEAFNNLVRGIAAGEVRILRHMGIQVNFEQAYVRAAHAMGKTTQALSDQEKVQIRTDAVLARSPLVDGSYVLSLTTAAGQMQSLQRYADDLKNALGGGLQPALFDVVTGMERLTKYAKENVDSFREMTAGVTALGVAGAVFGATKFLPMGARGVVAAAAGAGTYMMMNQDPVDATVEKYQYAFKKLDEQHKVMKHQLELGLIDEAAFKRFADQLPAYREMLKGRFEEEAAEVFKQRQAAASNAPEPTRRWWEPAPMAEARWYEWQRNKSRSQVPDAGFNVGGMQISAQAIRDIMAGGSPKFDKSGLVASNPLMKPDTTLADEAAAKKAAQRRDAFERLLDGLGEHALDPLARLIEDTTHKIRDLVQKYGPMTAGETGAVNAQMQGAIIRELKKRKVDMAEVPGTDGWQFAFGGLRSTAHGISKDEEAGAEKRAIEAVATMRERVVGAMQRSARFQEEMVRLQAGPGGEAETVNKIAAIKIAAAEKEFAITKDRARYEEQLDNARKDRLLQIAQIQFQQLEAVKNAAGSVWDSMAAKGFGGIADFIKGQFQVIGRTLFQNSAVELFKAMRDKLKLGDMIPGQVDSNGKLTPMGRILQGTPFGVDPAKLATDQNTMARKEGTVAERELKNAVIELKTAIESGSLKGDGNGGSAMGDVVDGIVGDKGGAAGKWSSRIMKTAAIAGEAFGVYAGIKQGGARGAMTAAGSAAMLAGSVLPMISKSLSMAGPIGMAVGAGLSLATMFMGDPKKKFEEAQQNTLNANKFQDPVASNKTTDLSGRDVDYDYRGRMRVSSQAPIINLNISAMDAKSVMDRSQDIATAVHKEIRLGHPVGLGIQAAILGT